MMTNFRGTAVFDFRFKIWSAIGNSEINKLSRDRESSGLVAVIRLASLTLGTKESKKFLRARLLPRW